MSDKYLICKRDAKKNKMSQVNSFRDLIVYQKAYKLAMEIFEISKSFPKEEKYSLTDQMRRSSRSVTSNIAEAWARKRYVKSFVNKLTDSLGEEYETEVWLDYSMDTKYITVLKHSELMSEYDEVRKMLISMINHPEKWCS
jgi:four helix bundle protein